MSYPLYFVADFGALNDLTLNVKLFDAATPPNQAGATITTGITNFGNGGYGVLLSVPDGHVGRVEAYDATDPTIKVVLAINPSEVENADVRTSTRLAAADYVAPPSVASIAAAVLTLSVAEIEDALMGMDEDERLRTLGGLILLMTKSISLTPDTQTVYLTDGTTVLAELPLTPDMNAAPVRGVGIES